MKVLHFFDGRRNNTRIIQIDFMLMLQQYCTLYIYGPKENEWNGEEISPLKFNNKLSFVDVVKELNPDVVIMPEYDLSKLMIRGMGNLKKIKSIPKVSIEIDYYSILDTPNWFKKIGIDFIINRGPYSDSVYRVPHVWLPWSAHDMFYTDETSDYFSDRIRKVVFVGGGRYSRNKYYQIRQKAIRMLEEKKLVDYIETAPPRTYKKFLSEYEIGLSCSFKGLQMAPAKVFEIMASGAVLLTTHFIHKDILFGNEKCFFEYREDCTDLLDITEKILSDFDFAEAVTKNALRVINTKHLHKHRIKELYNILYALYDGTPIPKVWGV
jgi:hypothetical protein